MSPVRTPARTWRALGTYVHLATDDPDALPVAQLLAREVLDHVDRTCSRFRPDSDLVRANAGAGSWVRVDPWLAAAIQVAVEAAGRTDGLVDPTMGLTIAAAGYDRDLALLPAAERLPAAVPVPVRRAAWRQVQVDSHAVRVPPGCAIDLGATGKAWAADLVARVVAEMTGSAVVVSLGGDVRVDGPDATAPCWPVAVGEDPDHLDGADVVLLPGGGLATSGLGRRRWVRGGVRHHHLLDPRTGGPVRARWRTVSAMGPTCVAANTASTAALVLGPDAVAWLEARGVPARLVDTAGRVTCTSSWPQSSSPKGARA